MKNLFNRSLVIVSLALGLSGCFLGGVVPPTAIDVKVSNQYGNLSPGMPYQAKMIQKGVSTLIVQFLDASTIEEERIVRTLTFDISGKWSLRNGMTYIKGAPENDDSQLLLGGNITHTSGRAGRIGRSGTQTVKGVLAIKKSGKEMIRLDLNGAY